MAHMHRGGLPISFNFGKIGGGMRGFFHGPVVFLYYDPKYYLMQIIFIGLMIMFFILFLTFSYKPSLEDPMKSIKSMYINSIMIVEAIISIFIILTTIIFKTQEKLLLTLKMILILSLGTVIIFGISLISLNKTCTRENFEEFYVSNYSNTEQEMPRNLISNFEIFLTGEQDFYVNEWMLAYKFFQVKVEILLLLLLAIIEWNVFLLVKTRDKKIKEDKLKKDDIVVYDDEENVKF